MVETMSIEKFLELAPKKLLWLERKGFRRAEELEESSPTSATLIYKGENLAFEFSIDIRDQCIDAEVIKVEGGKLSRNCDGGYSSDIYNHLVEHEGYRGSPTGNLTKRPELSKVEQDIDGWIFLIRGAGSKLLSDNLGV